ncbi:hypothetical protein [Cellvibrio fibrivorans]|uniref:Uncharacterized protein n=1 Tax=Cellvibrio fibrivorans TaxID=126350 RepID=A0ABU1USV8_9GAMM|nr:hypothetical protein [Cellvibrio fibrivorans]MDR7088222.1 hypothetical protein [Cellvibrio fibrivorans]
MENWQEITFVGSVLGFVVWYVKHKIITSTKLQIERFIEFEKNKNQELLESFKSHLGLQTELRKAKHLSIYERKVHALLDSFACISDCESPMGKISEDALTNRGENFVDLHAQFLGRKDILLNTFRRNSALFSDSIIEKFQQFKREVLMPYSSTYKSMLETLSSGGKITDGQISRLMDLEIEYGKFSKALKHEIKDTLSEI